MNTLLDAKGDRSRQAYDGYDRLIDLYFPSPTTPGATSTTDFESYGRDNNGNITSLKKGDNETIAYQIDALNRVWRKDVPGSATLYPLAGLGISRPGSDSDPRVTAENIPEPLSENSNVFKDLIGFWKGTENPRVGGSIPSLATNFPVLRLARPT